MGRDNPEAFKSPYGRAAGSTAMDYLQAIRAAHDRLDKLLKLPRAQWPRAKLFADLPATTP